MAITPVQRHWAKIERPAEASLNARREALLQRLSTAVFTESVGGLVKVWSGVSPTANHMHGILPMKRGQPRCGWTRFWLGSAGAVIQQIGLAVISVVFPPRCYRIHATTLKRNKDLQDDKEFYATGFAWKRDMNVA